MREFLIHQMLKLKVGNYCVPMLVHMGMLAPMHRHIEKERGEKKPCKFLSVCEAAAVVEVV